MTEVLTAQGMVPIVRDGIGGNMPPPLTPFEAFQEHITDLFEEAKNFLDGEPIENDGQAEAVSKLLTDARTAAKDADKARAEEKKPYLDAGKAVDATWKPLIDKAELAVKTAKDALTPWLEKLEEAKRAEAERLRIQAEEKAAAARQALMQAAPSDLSALQDAETLLKDAQRADKQAIKAEKGKASASGGDRAVSLRSRWSTVLVDPVAALKHYRGKQPEALKQWLIDQAEQDVRAGSRSIPGFEITERKVAV